MGAGRKLLGLAMGNRGWASAGKGSLAVLERQDCGVRWGGAGQLGDPQKLSKRCQGLSC